MCGHFIYLKMDIGSGVPSWGGLAQASRNLAILPNVMGILLRLKKISIKKFVFLKKAFTFFISKSLGFQHTFYTLFFPFGDKTS